jgi:hypothetical protein
MPSRCYRDVCFRERRPVCSDQLQAAQAGVAVASDDDMVVHGDAEGLGDFDNHPGQVDVGTRRCRIATGVIVGQPGNDN